MGNKDFWKRKPVGETILAKISRDFALRKQGIDPRTPEEIAQDDLDRKEAARNFDKYHEDYE